MERRRRDQRRLVRRPCGEGAAFEEGARERRRLYLARQLHQPVPVALAERVVRQLLHEGKGAQEVIHSLLQLDVSVPPAQVLRHTLTRRLEFLHLLHHHLDRLRLLHLHPG